MGLKEVLLEKVTRSEIDEALSNPNVRLGAEFEFTIPEFLVKYPEMQKKYVKSNKMEDEYQSYDDALEKWAEGPDDEAPPQIPKWAYEMGYESGEEIPSPFEKFKGLGVEMEEVFTKLTKEFLPLNRLPFKNYRISSDAHDKSRTDWMIKPDGSLGLSGIEIVSPVLTLDEYMKYTPKIFAFIDSIKGSKVGEDCGFHIGISLKNIKNLGSALDVTKLSLFLDEGYIYNFFATREFNSYAQSAFDSIQKVNLKKASPDLALQLIDEEKLKHDYPKSHYMAINIEHLSSNNEYIEFRYLGASNYHRKWDRIKAITAHYIYNLSLACDPTFKNREYKLKLTRLLNKIQLFTVVVKLNKMMEGMDDKPEAEVAKMTKEWELAWKIWKSLYIYKEAVDMDKENKSARKAFDRLCRMLDIREDDLIWDFNDYGQNFISRYLIERKNGLRR